MLDNLCCRPQCAMSLYQSLQGKYFVGLSREEFGGGKYAWAGLFNPVCSGALLFVNVFTISNVTEIPFSYQVWLNTNPPGDVEQTDMVSSTNTALVPLPRPKVDFLFAQNTDAEPVGGTLVFGRRCPAESTIVHEEDGKFIIPPGGNLLINLLPPETGAEKILGRIAFGWWEERC